MQVQRLAMQLVIIEHLAVLVALLDQQRELVVVRRVGGRRGGAALRRAGLGAARHDLDRKRDHAELAAALAERDGKPRDAGLHALDGEVVAGRLSARR